MKKHTKAPIALLAAISMLSLCVAPADAMADDLPVPSPVPSISQSGPDDDEPSDEPTVSQELRNVEYGSTSYPLKAIDGRWTVDLPTNTSGDMPQVLTVLVEGGEKPRSYELTRKDEIIPTSATLGVVDYQGTVSYVNVSESTTITQAVEYSHGKEVSSTIDGQSFAFTKDGDGFHANTSTLLDTANRPMVNDVEVDGVAHRIVWSDAVSSKPTSTTTVSTLAGQVSGSLTVDGVVQPWIVDVTASRVEGKVAGLAVLARAADGATTTHAVVDFDSSRVSYSVTLPAASVSNSFTLGYSSASTDVSPVEGDAIAPTLGEGASRILKVSLNGVIYTVTVRFEAEQPQPSNIDARLSGIYVNYQGNTSRGSLIDGWNPDILSYTIQLEANASGVFVLPEAPSRVGVRAADVTQSGYSTKQSWIVTAASGQSRIYSVTIVRAHTEPTADEAFKPGKVVDQGGTTQTEDRAETGLVSHGYVDAGGNYVPVDADSYRIPEDGTFSYASFAGQTVTVGVDKASPMNYTYTVNVLAPDGTSFAAHTYRVTYVTGGTAKAELSGITVNNAAISGFDPSVLEYAAQVGNLDHWTIIPSFDRHSGMSVTTHKERSKAVITVTSADGLNTRMYVVNVSVAPSQSVDGAVLGDATLASTGSATSSLIIALVSLLIAAGAVIGLRFLIRKKNTDAGSSNDDEAAAEPAHDAR